MTTSRARRTITGVLASLALSVTAVVGVSGAAQAQDGPSVQSTHGCPSGAVCIYPDDSWNGGQPSHAFYSYGGHNFWNQYGEHRVFNNQHSGAMAQVCWGQGGTSCPTWIVPGFYRDMNLTSFNSVRLSR